MIDAMAAYIMFSDSIGYTDENGKPITDVIAFIDQEIEKENSKEGKEI